MTFPSQELIYHNSPKRESYLLVEDDDLRESYLLVQDDEATYWCRMMKLPTGAGWWLGEWLGEYDSTKRLNVTSSLLSESISSIIEILYKLILSTIPGKMRLSKGGIHNMSSFSPGYYMAELLSQAYACTWTSDCQAPGQVPSPT